MQSQTLCMYETTVSCSHIELGWQVSSASTAVHPDLVLIRNIIGLVYWWNLQKNRNKLSGWSQCKQCIIIQTGSITNPQDIFQWLPSEELLQPTCETEFYASHLLGADFYYGGFDNGVVTTYFTDGDWCKCSYKHQQLIACLSIFTNAHAVLTPRQRGLSP